MTGQFVSPDSEMRGAYSPVDSAAPAAAAPQWPTDPAFFAAAVQSSEDAIIGTAPDFTIHTWNTGAERLYGYRAEEVVGLPFALLVPQDRHEEHARCREKLQTSGRGISTDAVRRRADGSLVDVSVRVSPVWNAEGLLLGYCSIARDMSETKRAARALQESETRYRTLVAATAQIVWTNTPDGEMKGANADWGAFTGQSENQYQGYGWTEAVHPDDSLPTVSAWQEAVAACKTFLFEHRLRRHDGEYRIFSIRAVPVLEDSGAIREWVGVHTDITERKALEAGRESVLAKQQAFLRDVLASVTDGHLILCDAPADLPTPFAPAGPPFPLSKAGGLWELRQTAQEAARAQGFAEDRCYDLVTAVSEAGMNAIVHVGEGTAQVCVDTQTRTVQVWVQDQGAGISLENLPQATLKPGFTTAGTLGHGMKMMLQTADRVHLLTNKSGTTVVVEQEQLAPIAAWQWPER